MSKATKRFAAVSAVNPASITKVRSGDTAAHRRLRHAFLAEVGKVAVIFTGGTISMRHDPVAGGNVPVLSGADLLASVPGLDRIATIIPIDRGLTPAKVDLSGVNPRDLDAKLTPVSRLRQRDVTDVVFKIEVGVVHPVRHVQTAGQFRQSTPERRREMQTGVDLFEDALEGDSAARCRCGVVEKQHLNLHRGFRSLGAQHHVVCPAQLLHVKIPRPTPQSPG